MGWLTKFHPIFQCVMLLRVDCQARYFSLSFFLFFSFFFLRRVVAFTSPLSQPHSCFTFYTRSLFFLFPFCFLWFNFSCLHSLSFCHFAFHFVFLSFVLSFLDKTVSQLAVLLRTAALIVGRIVHHPLCEWAKKLLFRQECSRTELFRTK